MGLFFCQKTASGGPRSAPIMLMSIFFFPPTSKQSLKISLRGVIGHIRVISSQKGGQTGEKWFGNQVKKKGNQIQISMMAYQNPAKQKKGTLQILENPRKKFQRILIGGFFTLSPTVWPIWPFFGPPNGTVQKLSI